MAGLMREGINRLGEFGPGGIKCHCCAPGNRRDRRKLVRPARRKATRRAIREGAADYREAKAEKEEA